MRTNHAITHPAKFPQPSLQQQSGPRDSINRLSQFGFVAIHDSRVAA